MSAATITRTFAVTYSYATWDKNWRGQQGTRVEAVDEADAIGKIRKGQTKWQSGPCPSAEIVRCKEVTPR